ncbi:unnamed protein product [Clavelina lepadiformis]|uniref:G-protein coupled receptors family 1 profile domain-containing protein n=1 Tax=Clavelina lepadiformis TaxID=159417 RepID=A0ABP0GR14_CLALP
MKDKNITARFEHINGHFKNISLDCPIPGFCSGSMQDLFINCFNQTWNTCQQCGVGREAAFMIGMIIIGLMIFFGNALVVCIGYRRWKRDDLSRLDICKVSLAFADIITAFQFLVVIPNNIVWSMKLTPAELIKRWLVLKRSPEAHAGGMFLMFGVTSSIFHLLFVAMERFYALIKSANYVSVQQKSMIIGLSVVWSASILASTGAAWFPHSYEFRYFPAAFLFIPGYTESHHTAAATAAWVVLYVIPFILLLVSCAAGVVFVCRNGKKRAGKNSPLFNRKKHITALKTIVFMQIGFTATTIPTFVVAFSNFLHQSDCAVSDRAYMIAFYIGMANSLVNVIIYSLRHQKFRDEICDIFKPGSLRKKAAKSALQLQTKTNQSNTHSVTDKL